jgi:hypothetical protein
MRQTVALAGGYCVTDAALAGPPELRLHSVQGL